MHLNNFFLTLLKTFEQTGEIYNAMESGDAVEMIGAAGRAMTRLNVKQDFGVINKKSLAKSKEFRELGNSHYKSGRNKSALVAYNKAIAYALPGKHEMLLAVSNRSAVLFTMRNFSCISDIHICLTMGSPPDLANKLKKRMLDCQSFVKLEVQRNINFQNQFISTFFETEFVRGKDVACASSDVAFINNDGLRQITAKRRIAPGKIVAIEPAFVICDSNGYDFLSCYHCNELLLNPIPCTNCCYAMFCSGECLSLCNSDYHSVECQIVDVLEKIYTDPKNTLAIRAAIKLSLKLGWDGFIAASENIGSSRMKDASTREMYSVEEPLSMLSYDDSQELVEGRMFNGSVICAIVLWHFDKLPKYFPKETTKRAAAKRAMSKILFHLYVHFTNMVCFANSAYDYKSESYKCVMQSSMGWFSMSSKLKHSCQPNLLVVGLNDRIALLSLRTIEKGEELTISFIDHFLDYDLSHSNIRHFRAPHLFLRTKKMCSCNVCKEEWSCSDIKYEPMTDRQTNLYRRFQPVKDINNCVDKTGFRIVCEMLDTFSVKSNQYHEAYRTLKRFLCLSQCILSSNQGYTED